MVTEAEANRLIAAAKVVAANLKWRFQQGGYRIEAAALVEGSGEVLRLVGYVGKKNRSFALLYRNTPIRKFTVHDRHTDAKTGVRVTGPHKHWWDDEYEDRRVYVPTDIRIGDPNDELVDFLEECNVDLRAPYNRASFPRSRQGELL